MVSTYVVISYRKIENKVYLGSQDFYFNEKGDIFYDMDLIAFN